MNKRAQSYIKARQSDSPRFETGSEPKELPPVDRDAVARRQQETIKRRDGLIDRGLVSISNEFAKVVRALGILLEHDPEVGTWERANRSRVSGDFWVEVWVLAAWVSYTLDGTSASIVASPTDEFRAFMSSLTDREKYLLVAELMFARPHVADQARSVRAWLRRQRG